jgi:hypothetical protein
LDFRVGGHLRPDPYSATAKYTERYGIEAAVEVVRFEIAHMKILEELVRKEKIDCDLTFTRSLEIYLDADELATMKDFYDSLVDRGLDFIDDVKYLSQEEAQKVSNFVPVINIHSFAHLIFWADSQGSKCPGGLQLFGRPPLALQIDSRAYSHCCCSRPQSSNEHNGH